ncbi:aspartate carbamoyltransferase [Patescibacteria group bacterium]|nr:aspartate carbamoyltransferase [Patescibacteria group bacterium]
MKLKDIISINDLNKKDVLFILDIAEKIEAKRIKPNLGGQVLATLFYEPSTRTRFSFETAMKRLGGEVISMADIKSTSAAKGESLRDTIKVIGKYADIIVIRHPLEGSARLAAESTDKPVINAGDGANQHPTQTLLDLYAIRNSQNTLDKLKVALCGDLKYGRTVHSLAYALSFFDCELFFISPQSLTMPKYILEDLKNKKIKFQELKIEDSNNIMGKLDILYATRIQKERFPDLAEYEKVKDAYVITPKLLKKAKRNLRILHPLPRVKEITTDVDSTPYAFYFEQVGFGIPIRQALLSILLDKIK